MFHNPHSFVFFSTNVTVIRLCLSQRAVLTQDGVRAAQRAAIRSRGILGSMAPPKRKAFWPLPVPTALDPVSWMRPALVRTSPPTSRRPQHDPGTPPRWDGVGRGGPSSGTRRGPGRSGSLGGSLQLLAVRKARRRFSRSSRTSPGPARWCV